MELTVKSLLIDLLKWRYGKILAKPLESFPRHSIRSVVILVQERIGDTILMTPSLKHLRRFFPDLEITVVGVRDFIELLRDDPHISRFYNLKRAARNDKRELFSTHFDLLFNTKDHPSFTFMYLSRKIKARWRLGLNHSGHRGFYDYLIPMELERPVAEKNGAILDLLGPGEWRQDLRPYFTPGPVSPTIHDFSEQHLKEGSVIGINLSASNENKSWKTENFRELLRNTDLPVIIFSMPEKVEEKRMLEKEFQHVISSPVTETIYDLAHLVRRLNLLITPDTSLVHIASCFNIPVVALYRCVLDSRRFPPFSDRSRVLVSSTELTNDIPPAEVVAACRSILEEIG